MKKLFIALLLGLSFNCFSQSEFHGKWIDTCFNVTIYISSENSKTVIQTILNETGEVIDEEFITYKEGVLRSTIDYRENNWKVNKIYTFYNKNKIAVNYNNKQINTTIFFENQKN